MGTNATSSDQSEILTCAARIYQELNDRIADLNTDFAASIISTAGHTNVPIPIPLVVNTKSSGSPAFALAWAIATRLYLSAIMSASTRGDAFEQSDITHLLKLFKHVQPCQLRSLAWPIFVAGCAASDVHEVSFRTLLSGLGRTNTVGALNDALEMLECVWQLRRNDATKDIDITSCFAILGSPTLLI